MVQVQLRGLQWERGVRAAISLGAAMVVCHGMGLPPGAAALGAFNALLVDNGGPYRTRLATMAMALLGGAAALIVGSLVPEALPIALMATLVVAFGLVFARVLSQPLASSGVLILVTYFAGVGGAVHTLSGALLSAGMLLLGGGWAVLVSLLLWPVDPFRPARLAVAECYGSLAEFAGKMQPDGEAAAFEWQRGQRVRMEAAGAALGATAARAPSRTIRARNLAVLLETGDLLLARAIRLTELTGLAKDSKADDAEAAGERLKSLASWLGKACAAVSGGLQARPADGGAAFCPEGSQRLHLVLRRRDEIMPREAAGRDTLLGNVQAEERGALLEIETAFDAVAAIWTGTEVRRIAALKADDKPRSAWDWGWIDEGWRDAVRANWTMQSAIYRHALRAALVGALDVVVMRLLHLNHGFWLPMTSIILLQPYSAGTARKSMQRVSGTVAGGMVAALLAAWISEPWVTLVVITVLGSLTVATFAVDYAVYSFFLTPTFVLMSLPHPHDWRYAGIRVGLTLLGATIALAAMRLLWPERAEEELGRLLRRGAAADAAYLRTLVRFWAGERDGVASGLAGGLAADLAPARRACGLASNDAEEAVDRVMQEPQFGRLSEAELRLRNEALTFATYLRRLTQSVTTLAVVGRAGAETEARLECAAKKMEAVASGEDAGGVAAVKGSGATDVAEEQMLRVERQVGILVKTAAGL